jgi:hypothetical protein
VNPSGATPDETLIGCLAADVLHLILVPSEGARPGSVRRYQAPRARRMEERVVRGVKNLLTDRSAELRALALSWSGGEPLEPRDLVLEILEHAERLRRRHPGLAFQSDLSTGGDLLEQRAFEQLVDLGVGEFRVTFDGEDLRSSRSSSYGGSAARLEQVWSNLADLRTVRRPFTVCVRLPAEDHGELSPHVERYHRVLRGDTRFDLTLCTPPEILAEEPAPTSFVVRPDGRVDRCSPLAAPRADAALGRLHESGLLELDGPELDRLARDLHAVAQEDHGRGAFARREGVRAAARETPARPGRPGAVLEGVNRLRLPVRIEQRDVRGRRRT